MNEVSLTGRGSLWKACLPPVPPFFSAPVHSEVSSFACLCSSTVFLHCHRSHSNEAADYRLRILKLNEKILMSNPLSILVDLRYFITGTKTNWYTVLSHPLNCYYVGSFSQMSEVHTDICCNIDIYFHILSILVGTWQIDLKTACIIFSPKFEMCCLRHSM